MRRLINSNAGFSLIEMMVVMVIFVVVLLITSSAMKSVLTGGTIVHRSDESNIEGVIGLEMLRRDLAQAGYGLFTGSTNLPVYAEAAPNDLVLGALPASNNDANSIPRAVVANNNLLLADSVVLNSTDYIAIKATSVASNAASQRWTYVPDTGVPHLWGVNDFVVGDRIIALSKTYDAKMQETVHDLVSISSSNYEILYSNAANVNYTPQSQKRFYFYGVNSAGGAAIRAPFNRADYFVRRPVNGFPSICSPAAGILYKAVMSHANGTMDPEMPILDCVADMQIVLGWNTQPVPEGSNAIDVLSNADGTQTAATPTGAGLQGLSIPLIMQDPGEIRKRLRQIKVYILVQDGARDPNFTNTNTALPLVGFPPGLDNGEGALVQRAGQVVPGSIDLTVPNMLNYHWKVYRVVVKPKNLG